ncbi:MAG: 50S ribosomal protein L11 methyltransferase [Acidobacteriota bacterium]
MAEPQSWYSIAVTVPPEAGEAIEYAFNSLEALGTEINHLKKKNSERVTVIGYFNHLPNEENVQDELHFSLQVYGLTEDAVLSVERSEVKNTDWLAEWKKHWKPSVVGTFVVAPPWSDVDQADKILIRIEPNMAFGTGTHETTRLCLEAIEKHYKPGDSFLDVGTGTGILAIAAAKLNARSQISNLKLMACDTDVDSVAIAKENTELNGVSDLVDTQTGSISDETPAFEFVCANLTLDVIEPLLPLLLKKSSKTLVLSGILCGQERQIVAALESLSREPYEISRSGEWMSVVISDE